MQLMSASDGSQFFSSILMIRPVNFAFNEQTAPSNEFQTKELMDSEKDVNKAAQNEFDGMVASLRKLGVDLEIYEDTPEPVTPDAIFPNNWISFHPSGKVILYPMMALNRRDERRQDILEELAKKYQINEVIDLTYFEKEDKFLEGTGSMVLDHSCSVAYACLSPRTHPEVLSKFSEVSGFRVASFHALDEKGIPIYHTNVLMCIGDVFAVICLEAIPDLRERQKVRQLLEESNKNIVEISLQQVRAFAGNMLFVKNAKNEKLLVMSAAAHNSLTEQQKKNLIQYASFVYVDLSTIEKNGGGSARCMMAEIYLQLR